MSTTNVSIRLGVEGKTWLMIPRDRVPEDGEWSSGIDRLHAGDPAATGRIRTDCFARSLETGLRDGRLDALFSDWMARFHPKFDHFEREWIGSAADPDAALRQRYADSDLIEEPT